MAWRDRAVDDAASVRRSREKVIGKAERIVAACRELYYDTGGQDFTIQELSAKAGIALQTFYRYFPSKDQLLLAVLEDVVRDSYEEMAATARRARTPLRRIEIMVTTPLMTTGPDLPVYSRLLVSEHLRLEREHPREIEEISATFLDALIEFIEEAVAAGDLPARPQIRRDARLIQLIIMTSFHRVALGLEQEDRNVVASHVWQFCLGALQAAQPVAGRSRRS